MSTISGISNFPPLNATLKEVDKWLDSLIYGEGGAPPAQGATESDDSANWMIFPFEEDAPVRGEPAPLHGRVLPGQGSIRNAGECEVALATLQEGKGRAEPEETVMEPHVQGSIRNAGACVEPEGNAGECEVALATLQEGMRHIALTAVHTVQLIDARNYPDAVAVATRANEGLRHIGRDAECWRVEMSRLLAETHVRQGDPTLALGEVLGAFEILLRGECKNTELYRACWEVYERIRGPSHPKELQMWQQLDEPKVRLRGVLAWEHTLVGRLDYATGHLAAAKEILQQVGKESYTIQALESQLCQARRGAMGDPVFSPILEALEEGRKQMRQLLHSLVSHLQRALFMSRHEACVDAKIVEQVSYYYLDMVKTLFDGRHHKEGAELCGMGLEFLRNADTGNARWLERTKLHGMAGQCHLSAHDLDHALPHVREAMRCIIQRAAPGDHKDIKQGLINLYLGIQPQGGLGAWQAMHPHHQLCGLLASDYLALNDRAQAGRIMEVMLEQSLHLSDPEKVYNMVRTMGFTPTRAPDGRMTMLLPTALSAHTPQMTPQVSARDGDIG